MVRFITDDRVVEKDKPVPLRVIAAGVPRAATSSIQAALERLGFGPCLHMAHVLPHPSRERLMLAAACERDDPARRHALLRELVEGHASVADFPVVFFAEDLMDMYPAAAIVLNQRRGGAAAWSASARGSFAFFFGWGFRLTGLPFTTDRLWWAINVEGMDYCERRYGTRDCFAPEVYEAHNAWVREAARRRGREVLEFVPEQGWAPLCEFLGVEVPDDEPFPRLNEKRAFQIIKAIFIGRGVLAYTAMGVGLWAGSRYAPLVWGFAKNWGARLLFR